MMAKYRITFPQRLQLAEIRRYSENMTDIIRELINKGTYTETDAASIHCLTEAIAEERDKLMNSPACPSSGYIADNTDQN